MQKRNRSPIDTGHRQKRKVGDIVVPKGWWDIARHLFFCRILCEDPYPVHVDKLSGDSNKEAHEILSTAIKVFDISKQLSTQQVFACFKPCSVALTTKLLNCQSAA